MCRSTLTNYMIKRRCSETSSSFSKRVDQIKHVASITTRKGNVLAIGSNKYHSTIKHGYSIHAEADTIQRAIRPAYIKYGRSLNKRRIPVDITIIRTTMVNSHPCLHCINIMASNPIFAIKRVYYSNDGDLSYCSMSSLLDINNPHISKANRSTCCDEEEDSEDDDKEALWG
jgi:hypothetical protein